MKTLEVGLGDRAYPIHIGDGLLAPRGRAAGRRSADGASVIVTNAVVAAHHLAPLQGVAARRAARTSTSCCCPTAKRTRTGDAATTC